MAGRYRMHNQLTNDFIDENFEGICIFYSRLQLTAKLNLNCVHSYLKPDRGHQYFTVEEFMSIFDTLIERGLSDCYFNGDILIHSDFEEMFVYAKKKGGQESVLSKYYKLL